ncbi:hypothetical protein ACQEVG_31320 [Streptomyces sp. CA-135486]|uniref:hypothetical protein n=1 Tax=Streptomyces sp. CA-135486 TaxID=3240049 RepID=UPI003D8A32E4
MTPGHRTEHDLLGEREVPADAYWGVRTLRACENFPTTGTPIAVSGPRASHSPSAAAGITAGTGAMRAAFRHSIGLVTALNLHIGHSAATGIAR